MNEQGPPFFGKFQGVVTDNRDPNNRGRVRAKVQDVLGDEESGWALPAVPYAGNGVGLYLIPPVDSFVWVEFEHGDPDYPIWTGCFWGGRDRLPGDPVTPDVKVLKTDSATITLDDTAGAGGITIETTAGTGAKIVMDQQGIEISNGTWSIKLSASSVSINDGALEVM